MTPARHPLLIIGLDGAGWNVLDPLIAGGQLPHLQALAGEGLRGTLLSTLPTATLPAWSSFLTAAEPARHGVADMLVRRPGAYDLVPASGRLRTEPTFLARLSARGRRVACLGMPGTYPPEPLAGLCIAGFDAPGARAAGRDAISPASAYDDVQALGGWRYATFNEHVRRGADGLRDAVSALLADIDAKERVIAGLARREPWDVLCVHLQASDTAAHHLWHTYDAASPRHGVTDHADALPSVYRRLDALVGRLRGAMPEARVLVVSDHGMGGASDVAVHLNRVLHEAGLLQFIGGARQTLRGAAGSFLRAALRGLPKGSMGLALKACPAAWAGPLMATARGLGVDHAGSVAFSDELDYAPAIWLNRVGVFPCGTVRPDDVASLTQRVREVVLALRDPRDGARLVDAVHGRDDLPAGPHADRLPDLLIEPAWPGGYRPSFLPSPGPGPAVRILSPRAYGAPRGAGMPGVHRREGVFIAAGPGLPALTLPPLHIAQAGASVYALMGEPLPDDLDARLPEPLAGLLAASREATQELPSTTPDPYTPAQSAALMERLEHMGYL